jgi:hypothetical protein
MFMRYTPHGIGHPTAVREIIRDIANAELIDNAPSEEDEIDSDEGNIEQCGGDDDSDGGDGDDDSEESSVEDSDDQEMADEEDEEDDFTSF